MMEQQASRALAAAKGATYSDLIVAVTAFVVPHTGAILDQEKLKRLVYDAKGAHQAPKLIFEIAELPTTFVGKIGKKRLRMIAQGSAQ